MRCIRDVNGSEVQGEVHTRAGSILRIGSGSRLGVHDIPIQVQKRGLVPPLVCLEEPLVNAVGNPVDQFHNSVLPRKALTARCWLEGMLGS